MASWQSLFFNCCNQSKKVLFILFKALNTFHLAMFIKISWGFVWTCETDRQKDKDWHNVCVKKREPGSRVGLRSLRTESKFTQQAQWWKQSAKSKGSAASLKIISSGPWLLCSSQTWLSPLLPLCSHTIQVYSSSDRSS